MKKVLYAIILAGLLFSCGTNEKQQETESNPTTATASAGLTEASFGEKIKGKPMVIIDYNATWCGPCKQLSPILKDWVKAQNGKVELIEIDVDENQELAKSKKIEAIPYLEMYKNGVKTWSSVGLIGKEELDKSLR
jgi:thioredoxin 1